MRSFRTLFAALGLLAAACVSADDRRVTLSAQRPFDDLHRTVFAAPGAAGHQVVQRLYSYEITESSHEDFVGARTLNVAHMDEYDGSGTHAGYATWRLRDGSEIYVRFDGAHRADGRGERRSTSFRGTLRFVGGTGRHRAGAGTYEGRAKRGGTHMDVDLTLADAPRGRRRD